MALDGAVVLPWGGWTQQLARLGGSISGVCVRLIEVVRRSPPGAVVEHHRPLRLVEDGQQQQEACGGERQTHWSRGQCGGTITKS